MTPESNMTAPWAADTPECDWQAPRPCAVTVALLVALAEDVDAYIWANGDVDTTRLVAVVTECCQEAGLGVGAA